MRVRVLYFAVVRERLRRDEESVELASGATVGALLDELSRRYEAVAQLRPYLQVARNLETARPDEPLSDGDEVALIPPVSGGAGPFVGIRDRPIALDEVVAAVGGEESGGVVTFTGQVRRTSHGKTIERLEYEAYGAMAEAQLRKIAVELERAHGARVAILHRTGTLAVGEVAVVIACAAAHRGEAFAACREAIERLKKEVPIWKKEIATDGESWIGLGP